MKKLATLFFLAMLSCTNLLAEDAPNPFVVLADDLITKASACLETAQRPEEGPKPSRYKNWQMRGAIKDIRKLSLGFRDRAARGRARTLVSKIRLKRIVANMEEANFYALNGGAEHLTSFPEAWKSVRDAIGALVSEMCCGDQS